MHFRPTARFRAGILFLSILPLVVIPAANAATSTGHVLVPESWRTGHPGPYTLKVALVVDEEWSARFGGDARREALAILDSASEMFAPAKIRLDVVSYGSWVSPDGARSIRDMYRDLQSVPRGEADMVVALTAQYHGQEGGIAAASNRQVLIKHHSYRPDQDALVVAHEIGHQLGLHHHACPHLYCVMSSHSYDERRHFCPDHLRLLQANGGVFKYLDSLN
ncbi:MAG: M12 family metallo-peptidase [Dehalococcoidia bacterium]|nr:M12 family metallo-peptidase [Dehalococcoidia bacterium]